MHCTARPLSPSHQPDIYWMDGQEPIDFDSTRAAFKASDQYGFPVDVGYIFTALGTLGAQAFGQSDRAVTSCWFLLGLVGVYLRAQYFAYRFCLCLLEPA